MTALDITHDPRNGVDTYLIADHLRTRQDPRIKYVISNGRIWSSETSPFVWRMYTGSNPHRSHIHISVKASKAHYDNKAPWDLGGRGPVGVDEPKPVLRRNDRGEWVKMVQTLLKIAVYGIFGPKTEAAVREFQASADLKIDGIVGPLTWAELEKLEQDPMKE